MIYYLLSAIFILYLAYRWLPGLVVPVAVNKIAVSIPTEADPDWKPAKYLEKPSIVDSKNPENIVCYDPCTGGYLGTVKANTAEDVKEMIAKARKAQRKWSTSPNFSFEKRRAVLRTLQDWIVNHQTEIARVCCRDSGKTMVDASFGEILTTLEKLRWTIEEGEACLKTDYRSSGPVTVHKSARVDYLPFGVVGCIVSWNYPFHNTFGPLISAIFAGNAIVVKTSEQVAWSCRFWESIIRQALEANGLDPELVWFATGFREAGEALTANVDKVTFIGSPNVGKMVMKHASETLTPVVLELGGKDCAVVFEDADFNQVCNIVMRGTYQNCGQNCIGLERIIIQDSIHDKFVEEMAKRVKALRQGPTLYSSEDKVVDVGAMTMSNASTHIGSLVKDAVAKGARLVCGGDVYIHPEYPNGTYFAPTILDKCTTNMDICTNEVFGPVMTIYTFSTEQQAIDLANSSGYGLGSCVFTNDIAKGERVMQAITSGMCNLNDFAVNYLCQSLPFGGRGVSGFDRFAGVEGLRGNTVARAVTTDRIPGVKTDIPPMLNYPMKLASTDFVEGLCSMMYENGAISRLLGLKRLLMSMLTKSPKKNN